MRRAGEAGSTLSQPPANGPAHDRNPARASRGLRCAPRLTVPTIARSRDVCSSCSKNATGVKLPSVWGVVVARLLIFCYMCINCFLFVCFSAVGAAPMARQTVLVMPGNRTRRTRSASATANPVSHRCRSQILKKQPPNLNVKRTRRTHKSHEISCDCSVSAPGVKPSRHSKQCKTRAS